MTTRSNGRHPFAWTEKELDQDVLPDRRRLATALQRICRHLVITTSEGVRTTHPTQAQAAAYLKVSETTLTRYLQGRRIPPDKTAEFIFNIAWRDTGDGQKLGITQEELLELRARAEQERCGNCSRHRDAARAAGQKLRSLEETHEQLERSTAERTRELGELRQRVAALKQETRRVKDAQSILVSEAGPQKLEGAARAATLLPVPHHQGDRQQSKNGTLAARNVGHRAEELLRGSRPDTTLALLRHTADAYTPAEVALLIALLREWAHDDLADNLAHIFARDRHDHDVVRAALILHEQQAVADAEALLRTAAAHPGSAVSRAQEAGTVG
ncbi:hypothetical protein [Streptomyces sp. NPDC016675]|uniref:hypothetical protein n=1 Tax=Streptomyces sp. NPDC016675 TaxID=3364970 RepID=UPI0037033F9A